MNVLAPAKNSVGIKGPQLETATLNTAARHDLKAGYRAAAMQAQGGMNIPVTQSSQVQPREDTATTTPPAEVPPDAGIGSGQQEEPLTNQFLNLMLIQLQNQDPTAPMDSNQMVSQLAQISTAQNTQLLHEDNWAMMMSEELQSILTTTDFAGKEVEVVSNVIDVKDGNTISGDVNLAKDYDNVTVRLYDSEDVEVGSIELGQKEAGKVPFGVDSERLGLPDGEYSIKIEGTLAGETAVIEPTPVTLRGKVEKVHFYANGVVFSVKGVGGEVPLLAVMNVSNDTYTPTPPPATPLPAPVSGRGANPLFFKNRIF